jgi:2'-5' RNA ligase
VIVAVPEAEPAVGEFRARHDRAAGWGVPAHVTVLYPFVAPELLTPAVLADLAAAIGSVPRFDVVFDRLSWFGDRVLWAAPSSADGFLALIAAVRARFPERLPYDGEHLEAVPHLTIGHDAPVEVLRAVEAEVEPRLPVRASIGSARLIQGSDAPSSWTLVAEFALRRPAT